MSPATLNFPGSTGPMAELVRRHDWAATAVGPIEHWPGALRHAVNLMLASPESMYVVWGADLTFFFNDAYAPILGPRLDGALGAPLQQLWADAWQAVCAPIARAFAGESSRFENMPVAMQRDGVPEDTWWTFSFSPIYLDDGSIGGAFCVTKEVTQTLVAQQRLSHENERLIALFDKSPMFMAFLSGPEHRIALANPGYERLVGNRDLLGKCIQDALPEVVDQGFLPLLDQVYRTGTPYIGKEIAYQPPLDQELSGSPRLLDIVFQPVMGEDGVTAGVFVQGLDITPQVELQRSMREVEARNRQIIDSARDFAIVASDLDGKVTLWNAGAQHIFGWTEAEMLGNNVDVIYSPEDVQAGRLQHNQQRSIASGGVTGERWLQRKSGELFWANGAMTVLRDAAGQALGFVKVLGDRTEQQRSSMALAQLTQTLEERVQARSAELQVAQERLRQSQKMEAVGQLTGGLAHDFNNLLTTISVGLELLELRIAQQRYDDIGRYLDMAQSSAARATALTQRLLAFSRRQTLAPTSVRVNAMVNGMLEILSRTLGPSIAISTTLEAEPWPVLVDVPQLENALLNLCINARDAMPEGGPLAIGTVNVVVPAAAAVALDMPAGDYVCLSVTDAGTGMDAGVIEKVFEPFFTTKPIGQGTGLGLSMIYGFTRQSGGQVSIDSQPGQGTAVHLYLPRFHGDAAQDALPATQDERAQALAAAQGTVLVVEDEAAIRALVAEVFTGAGYRVLQASDGGSGIQMLHAEHAIDLLVTDVGLTGGLNGRQVADAGRQVRPALPVLFITGYAASAAVGAGQLDKGMEVLTKPFTAAELERRARALLAPVATP